MFLVSSADLRGTNKTGTGMIIFLSLPVFFQVHLLQACAISRKYEVSRQKSMEMTNQANKTLKLKFYRVVSGHGK